MVCDCLARRIATGPEGRCAADWACRSPLPTVSTATGSWTSPSHNDFPTFEISLRIHRITSGQTVSTDGLTSSGRRAGVAHAGVAVLSSQFACCYECNSDCMLDCSLQRMCGNLTVSQQQGQPQQQWRCGCHCGCALDVFVRPRCSLFFFSVEPHVR